MKITSINGDNSPKYALHGAYEIVEVIQHGGSKNDFQNVKRVFFHKNYYIIFQLTDDSFVDYHIDIKPNKLILTDYDENNQEIIYRYNQSSGQLILATAQMKIVLKEMKWKELPLLQPLFHWTVDGI